MRAVSRDGARAAVASPSGLGLRGNSTPLRVVVVGSDFELVKQWAAQLLEHAEANDRLINPGMDFEQNQPQLGLSLDRAHADDLGISAEAIASTLQVMFALRVLTTYVDRGREYPFIAQAGAEDRRTPSDLANVFLRAGRRQPRKSLRTKRWGREGFFGTMQGSRG